jgi:hypothetical protein
MASVAPLRRKSVTTTTVTTTVEGGADLLDGADELVAPAPVDWAQRPHVGDDPATGAALPVEVQFVLVLRKWEVTPVDGHEFLRLTATLEFYWTDPRLEGRPTAEGVPDTIWRPPLIGCPGCSLHEAEKGKKLPTFYRKRDVSDGRLSMSAPLDLSASSPGWNLGDDLDRMRVFPFDSARIDLSVMLAGAQLGRSARETTDTVALSLRRPNIASAQKQGKGAFQQVQWQGGRHSGDYELTQVSYAIGAHQPPEWYRRDGMRSDYQVADVLVSLHLQRTPSFYLQKGMEPMYGAGFFGFLTYLTDTRELASRLSVLASLFLTCYAIQWVTIERLPRLPFSTVLDEVTKTVVTCLFLMAVGQGVCFQVGKRSDDIAPGLDFDAARAEQCDVICAAACGCYLLCYSLGYKVLYKLQHYRAHGGANARWNEGGMIRNKQMKPVEAYRLHTTPTFCRENKSWLGTGTPVTNLMDF